MKQPTKIRYKVCFTCKIEKPVIEFYKNKAKTTGLYGSCIECVKKGIKYPKSNSLQILYLPEDLAKESWRKVHIRGYDFPYLISDCGRVKIERTGKIGKPSFDSRGYPQIVLSVNSKRVGVRIHILVGQMFIANPFNLPQLNHKNGDKLYPHFSNLEWATAKDNVLHAFRMGLSVPFTSKTHPLSKMVIDKVTKKEYNSIAEAAYFNNIHRATLEAKLKNKIRNDTNLILLK